MIMVMYSEVVVMVLLLYQDSDQKHWDKKLRIRKAGDPVGMFDEGSITSKKSTLDPLQNHPYEEKGNVKNTAGHLPITEEEFFTTV